MVSMNANPAPQIPAAPKGRASTWQSATGTAYQLNLSNLEKRGFKKPA
jgi:hypothetical protein